MELFEAIHTRQTQGKVKPDALPRETIEKLLSAGAQAPNHYKVRPWRFVVLTGLTDNVKVKIESQPAVVVRVSR